REFATAHGFEDTNLLTEESRIAWLRWKETLSPVDKWGPSPYPPAPASPAGQKKLAQTERARGSYMLAESYAGGEFAGAAIWNGTRNSRGEPRRRQFAAHDGRAGRLFDSAYLFERRA
ncbi:MAG TPA: hypothetical protein VGO96_12640, partial [Pyrinomonadaceae bacterium]|nr:hypothetical protein [Pyrinomonadaceae bacterium]